MVKWMIISETFQVVAVAYVKFCHLDGKISISLTLSIYLL